MVGTGCGSSSPARGKDAGGDVAFGTGGAIGTGGLPGAGGASELGGRVGEGGGLGSGGAGAGGLMGMGGAKSGGTMGTGGKLGAGGYVYVPAGVIGTGGKPAGGVTGTRAGGSAAGGSGGGTGGATARDASADGASDGAGVDGGAAIVYSGCGYGGGIERAVIARFDARAQVCVTLVLESPHNAPDASFGMTISPNWGVAALVLWPASSADCATRNPPRDGRGASSASGNVTVDRTPGTIDIDAVFEFPATDGGAAQSVEMKAQGVDYMRNC
jgi:hypothetical protein